MNDNTEKQNNEAKEKATISKETESTSYNNTNKSENEAEPKETTLGTKEATETKSEEPAEEKTPEEQIKELEAQVAELKKAMLYKVAEFDNYRKRTIKEKADLILNGGKKVLEALLPVVDDLERAEINIDKANEVEALKEGLQLVFQKFSKTLEGLGLKKMDTIGQDFSTDFHEAVAFVPGKDEDKGKVIDCIQNGYTLNDQVIRYAKVAVGQ